MENKQKIISKDKNTYTLQGVEITFPFQPTENQKAYMDHVLLALNKKLKYV